MYKKVLIFGSLTQHTISVLHYLTGNKYVDSIVLDDLKNDVGIYPDDDQSLVYYVFGHEVGDDIRRGFMKEMDLVLLCIDPAENEIFLRYSLERIQSDVPVLNVTIYPDGEFDPDDEGLYISLPDGTGWEYILAEILKELYHEETSVSAGEGIPYWTKVWIVSLFILLLVGKLIN